MRLRCCFIRSWGGEGEAKAIQAKDAKGSKRTQRARRPLGWDSGGCEGPYRNPDMGHPDGFEVDQAVTVSMPAWVSSSAVAGWVGSIWSMLLKRLK